jgi:hypothetical protein
MLAGKEGLRDQFKIMAQAELDAAATPEDQHQRLLALRAGPHPKLILCQRTVYTGRAYGFCMARLLQKALSAEYFEKLIRCIQQAGQHEKVDLALRTCNGWRIPALRQPQ